jgi:hypothetical protein
LGKFCLKFDITKKDEKIENPKKKGKKKKKLGLVVSSCACVFPF